MESRTPTPPLTLSPDPPSASAMDGDEIDDEMMGVDWESLAILNGRTDFIILHDIEGCFKCWSLTSYYKIMSKDEELLLNGKRMFSMPGGKPSNIIISDLTPARAFYIKFITCGCFPVLKRIEVRDSSTKKRIGVIAEISKVVSPVAFKITNDAEGATFYVKNKINLFRGHDYEILGLNGSSKVATIDRHGPAHSLNITDDESTIVTCSNKALFISFCLFLV